jgi:hypothetical protein
VAAIVFPGSHLLQAERVSEDLVAWSKSSTSVRVAIRGLASSVQSCHAFPLVRLDTGAYGPRLL